MDIDLKTQKDTIRDSARRTRAMLNLSAKQQKTLCQNFFDSISLDKNICVASYWPHERELDTLILMDELIGRGVKVSLPIVEKDSRILKFVQWTADTLMQNGVYNIPHPKVDGDTVWLEPDVFLIPVLAFDRNGYRLGYGGGYYDSTLSHYRQSKEIVAIGLAYAEQACLFPLPKEDHDQRLDWIITEQSVTQFSSYSSST